MCVCVCVCVCINRICHKGWLEGWLVGFYGISTFLGYLTPYPFL